MIEVMATILSPILPNDYSYFLTEFNMVKKSVAVDETQFMLECRVNVNSKEEIDKFIVDLGRKSGTTYNKFKGDRMGSGKKVIVSGIRKCHFDSNDANGEVAFFVGQRQEKLII